jgi:protein O-GlcNAc transferase
MPDPRLQTAMHLRQSRDFPQAAAIVEQILAENPTHPDALHLQAILLWDTGTPAQTATLLQSLTATHPTRWDFFNSLGLVLAALDRHNEAIPAYRRAIDLKSDALALYNNLGDSLYKARQFEEAAQTFQRAVDLDPTNAFTHHRLAGALRAAEHFDQAITEYKKTLELDPTAAEAHLNMGGALKDIGEIDAALAEFDQYLAARPDALSAQSHRLYALHLHPDYNPQKVFAEHQKWATQFPPTARSYKNTRDPNRPLRIGYVSGDFHRHSVAFFFLNLLEAHNPSQFETFCYSNSTNADDITARIRKSTTHWRDIANINDDRAAEMIDQDQIDILVDLAGHTPGNRLPLFAKKPSPIQATYCGYPDTTGLTQIDYRLTDTHSDPPNQTEPFHTEKLIRLPGSFLCIGKMLGAPDVAPPPVTTANHITFGSFNALAKITSQMLTLWAKILIAVPNSRLLLKSSSGMDDPTPRRRLTNIFKSAGIDPARIDLRSRIPSPLGHLDLYRHVDIALDTYPYNGTTITAEALWMGVPTITLRGPTHVTRVGYSLLAAAGLEDLAADTPEQYVQIAARLAADVPRLKTIRSTLRQTLSKSPLIDSAQFARNVELAYRQMWLAFLSPLPGTPGRGPG